jgi:hypothetical protein
MNLSTSSITITGILIQNTAFHSATFNGVITNNFCKRKPNQKIRTYIHVNIMSRRESE